MRKKNYKGRCTKKAVPKCRETFRGYDDLMITFVEVLSKREDIVEIQCNVPIEGTDYTTDFLCETESGQAIVRECTFRKLLNKPMTMKLLQTSREYWLKQGADWGIVIDAE